MASSLPLPSPGFFFSCKGFLAIRSLYALPDRPGRFARPCENPRPVTRDRNRVLEVRRIASILGDGRPLIVEHPNARPAPVHHRLDSNDHSLLEPWAVPGSAVIRDLGFLVHFRSDAVAYKFANDRVAIILDPLLHRRRDIAE